MRWKFWLSSRRGSLMDRIGPGRYYRLGLRRVVEVLHYDEGIMGLDYEVRDVLTGEELKAKIDELGDEMNEMEVLALAARERSDG